MDENERRKTSYLAFSSNTGLDWAYVFKTEEIFGRFIVFLLHASVLITKK